MTPDVSGNHEEPPSPERSTVYDKIGSPPLLAGALQVNVAARSPAAARKFCGAVARPAGIATAAADITLSPMVFVAASRNM